MVSVVGQILGVRTMILQMRLMEPVQLDQNRLIEIVARLGARGADDLISRTMEELAVLLATVHKSIAAGRMQEAHTAALKIRHVAAHIGMPALSSVAQDLARLAIGRDAAAISAVTARLSRCGEASLMKVWDMKGQSM